MRDQISPAVVLQRRFEIERKRLDMEPAAAAGVILVKDGQLTEEGKRRGIKLPDVVRTLNTSNTDSAQKSANPNK